MYFSFSKLCFIYLMNPIDFTKDQSTVRRVIWSYIYTLTRKVCITNKTWNFLIFNIILEVFIKIGGSNVYLTKR